MQFEFDVAPTLSLYKYVLDVIPLNSKQLSNLTMKSRKKERQKSDLSPVDIM